MKLRWAGGAQRSIFRVKETNKKGARNTRALAPPIPTSRLYVQYMVTVSCEYVAHKMLAHRAALYLYVDVKD